MYVWSHLYSFFKYGKAILFRGTKLSLVLESIRKTNTSKVNCHIEVRAVQCSGAIFAKIWEHGFSLKGSGRLHTLTYLFSSSSSGSMSCVLRDFFMPTSHDVMSTTHSDIPKGPNWSSFLHSLEHHKISTLSLQRNDRKCLLSRHSLKF